MPNDGCSLVTGRSVLVEFEAGQHDPDRSGDRYQRQVQPTRYRKSRQRSRPMRESRRVRRERVETKHDEKSRKADTERACYTLSANPQYLHAEYSIGLFSVDELSRM